MTIDQDLNKIALQEKRLRFKQFDAQTAWAVGTALKAAAEKRQACVTIDIQLHGFPLFSYAMAGTSPDNWEWIRRKRNVVMRYHRSSYRRRTYRRSFQAGDGVRLQPPSFGADDSYLNHQPGGVFF